MSVSRFLKPTSFNITYVDPHEKLNPTSLNTVNNKGKLLYNNNDGKIDFYDGGLLLDIESYPTLASFPATGEQNKFYLDESQNKMYRWVLTQYYYIPHDVYSKVESDNNYYNKSVTYTKTENDNKYVIRTNQINDMTGSEINNLNKINVIGTLTADATAVTLSKNLNIGWNNINFVTQINDKLKLDELTLKALTDINFNSKSLLNANVINSTTHNTTTINSTTSNNTGVLTTTDLNVHGAYGINGKLRFNGANIDAMTRIIGTELDITGGYGINGKMRFNGTGIDFMNFITMNNNDILNVKTLGATDATITTINSTTGNITTLNTTTGGFNTVNATQVNTQIIYLPTKLMTSQIRSINDAVTCDISNTMADFTTGLRVGRADSANRELNAGTIQYKPPFKSDSMVFVGASATSAGGDRKVHVYDSFSAESAITAPIMRTPSIRLTNDTQIIAMGASAQTIGGNHEVNILGRLRINNNGANNLCAIYNDTGADELVINGAGGGNNVRIRDNLRIASVFANTVETNNISTSVGGTYPVSDLLRGGRQTWGVLGGVNRYIYNAPVGWEIMSAHYRVTGTGAPLMPPQHPNIQDAFNAEFEWNSIDGGTFIEGRFILYWVGV